MNKNKMMINRQNTFLDPFSIKGLETIKNVMHQIDVSKLARLLCHIHFDIDKRSSAFDNGKNSCDELISDNIYDSHSGFPFRKSSLVIFIQLSISMNSTNSSQMKQFLYLHIGYGTDLCFSSNTCSRLIIKRSYPRIASKFPPILKTSEIMGVYDQGRCDNETYPFDRGNQLQSGP